MSANEGFPWSIERLKRREIVCFQSMADVPPEAEIDKKTWQSHNAKSVLGFPLYVGDGPVFGVLTFDSMEQEREWPETLVNRLQLLAQVFANALARRRTDQALLNSYEEIEQLKERLQIECERLKKEITERKKTEEALMDLSSRLINAQEEERSRIARELHDDFSQRLGMVSVDLERVVPIIPKNPDKAAERIHELWKQTSSIGSDLNGLSHTLHSSVLDYLVHRPDSSL
jgi:signal transduction histidine kinase